MANLLLSKGSEYSTSRDWLFNPPICEYLNWPDSASFIGAPLMKISLYFWSRARYLNRAGLNR